ncbi:uncharacterized protein BDCG_17086 [Blastomyces dermatitidis ER-3]|uniref:Uncharacterized protein n=1 Tax=Ajellomyces dermatitidis (strain ER-3 / ATCC MYA-2586) TaxID=559297 RepID=A0ABX2VW98_AJEDR|nr:uncharacterized protein BDCG_17086 [Blastomyces dermatitidis ER-3]OAT01433.1 hypothetical protein BDCG_17086 [Blastomyces dermatitidis ER-3]
MGQIRKGGTTVGLGVGVLEHQRWTGFSRRSLLRYLHNYRSGIFQNREDWCIWLGLFTLQFVWHFGPGLWCGRGERGILPHRSFEQRPVHVWLDNSTTTQGMRSAMGSECSYDRGLFDGSIGGFLFEKSSEFVFKSLKRAQQLNKIFTEISTALSAAITAAEVSTALAIFIISAFTTLQFTSSSSSQVHSSSSS